MRVYSVPGRLVRDPATRRVVDADGVDVNPLDPHWVRLLADGDVTDEAPATPMPKLAAEGDVTEEAPAPATPKKKAASGGEEA